MTTKILTEAQIMRSTLRMLESENNPETAAAAKPGEDDIRKAVDFLTGWNGDAGHLKAAWQHLDNAREHLAADPAILRYVHSSMNCINSDAPNAEFALKLANLALTRIADSKMQADADASLWSEAGHPEQHSRYDTVDDIKFKGGMAGLRAAADLLNQASASDAGAIAKIQDILDEASTKLMFSGKAGDASGIVMQASALLNQPVTGGNIEAAKEKIAAAMISAEGGASESAPDNHASDNHNAKPVTEQQRMRSTLSLIEDIIHEENPAL